MENKIIYLNVPARSIEYEKNNITAEDMVIRIKESIQKLFDPEIRVKYKTKDIYWSEEMSEEVKRKLGMFV